MATSIRTSRPAVECASCGRAIAKDESYSLAADRRAVCNDCAASVAPPTEDALTAALAGSPPTIVRGYRGGAEGYAERALEAEGRRLAEHGYRLLSQAWAPGERPVITGVFGVMVTLAGLFFLLFVADGFLLALLTVLVGIALLAAYVGNIRPAVLTATFEAQRSDRSASSPSPASVERPAADRLRELEALHAQGLITDAELATRREAVLDAL
ncbi:MAG: hypothetical protein HY263_10935 [Chloroflexi bacterium]|nr:hypothetical protein [Chloroflexota bacterium]